MAIIPVGFDVGSLDLLKKNYLYYVLWARRFISTKSRRWILYFTALIGSVLNKLYRPCMFFNQLGFIIYNLLYFGVVIFWGEKIIFIVKIEKWIVFPESRYINEPCCCKLHHKKTWKGGSVDNVNFKLWFFKR